MSIHKIFIIELIYNNFDLLSYIYVHIVKIGLFVDPILN